MASTTDTFDIAMFSEAEAPAKQSARQSAFTKRTSKRMAVPGAMVGCARKTMFGTWKTIGVPFNVCDIAMNGVSFRNFGMGFDPGTQLRLNILVPGQGPVTVTGEVVWNRAIPHEKHEGPGVRAHVCGVRFKKYFENAWAALTVIMEEPKEASSKSTEDKTDSPSPDLSILA
jgi:hypothetical protein